MKDKIEALTDLHTRLVDSRDGYEQAMELADASTHRQLFSDMLERRRKNATEVRGFIERSGETLDDDGSVLAAAHRQWLSLRDTFGSGDEAVLAEVVRGEESLLEAYDKAIEVCGAGDAEFNWLSEQYTQLRMTVDRMKGKEKAAA